MKPISTLPLRLVVIGSLTLTLVVPALGSAAEEHFSPVAATPEVVAGEYLVRLSDGAGTLSGVTLTHVGFDIYKISESPTSDPHARAVELAAALGTTVVPNGLSRLFGDNLEPDASAQWSLENTGQFTGGVDDADMDAEEAWDAATGVGVVVAVIDSGADLDHPDLADNLWSNPGEIPDNGTDDDNNGYIDDVHGYDFFSDDSDPSDTITGHGTAVSGIIAAPVNGVGMAGVAYNAEIMVLQACQLLCPDDAVIAAMDYATAQGADVINLSLGRDAGGGLEDMMLAATQAAVDSGAVVVAAAGNDGTNNDLLPVIPASFDIDGLLAVAMTDHADVMDPSSNFGESSVHLGAPGVAVWTLDLAGGSTFWTGTSFATPATAGAAALLSEHRSCFSPSRIASTLMNTGDPVPSLAGKTISGRRLNAWEALSTTATKNGFAAAPAPAPVSFDGGDPGTMWDFGDGAMATGASATHVYANGIYQASDGANTYEIAAGLDFLDTCTNTFVNEIIWLSATGITLGCDAEPNFCPNDSIIRAHAASFIARALELPPATGDYFTDDAGVHEENINRLREAGITLGCDPTGTLFCPNDEVTREQMASLLARALALAIPPDDYFSDDDGSTHESNINALAASGITLGCEPELFCPKDEVERDEMAAFLFRGRQLLPS